MHATHGNAAWFGLATAVRRLMLLDFVPLFAIGFLLYMIKTGTGMRWQNILGILIAAGIFHSIDHDKHNPAATALIIGLVTLSAYGKVPPLRLRATRLCQHDFVCLVPVPQQPRFGADSLPGPRRSSTEDLLCDCRRIRLLAVDHRHESSRSSDDKDTSGSMESISFARRQGSGFPQQHRVAVRLVYLEH